MRKKGFPGKEEASGLRRKALEKARKRERERERERERRVKEKREAERERDKKERTKAARHVIYVWSAPRYAATALTVETRRRLGLVGIGRLIGSRACAHRLTTSIRGDRLLPSEHATLYLSPFLYPPCPLPMSTEP